MKSLIIATLLTFGLVAPACAQGTNAPAIEIVLPWARATPAMARTGAVYMTVLNKGTADDRIVALSTPAAGRVEMHKSENDNGVIRMIPVAQVAVAAGSKAVFRPNGYHMMLMELKAPLKEGESFPLSLTFEKAGRIDVTVKVEKMGAMEHGGMGDMKM